MTLLPCYFKQKIDRLRASLSATFAQPTGNRTLFASDSEEKKALLSRTALDLDHTAPDEPEILSPQDKVSATLPFQNFYSWTTMEFLFLSKLLAKEKKKALKELSQRVAREKELRITEQKLEVRKSLLVSLFSFYFFVFFLLFLFFFSFFFIFFCFVFCCGHKKTKRNMQKIQRVCFVCRKRRSPWRLRKEQRKPPRSTVGRFKENDDDSAEFPALQDTQLNNSWLFSTKKKMKFRFVSSLSPKRTKKQERIFS